MSNYDEKSDKKQNIPSEFTIGNPDLLPVERGKAKRTVGDQIARLVLTICFAVILGGTVVFSFYHIGKPSWNDAKEWLEILLPAETALLGTAVGFYFGRTKE